MRLACLALLALPLLAQPRDVYKVELTMHDATDASAKAGRRYLILLDSRNKGTFKIGNREPVATGSFAPSAGAGNPLVNTQFTYVDLGVNIDCQLEPIDNDTRMDLRVDLDVSGAMPPKSPVPNPVISQLKLSMRAIVVPGKRTIIASIDDPVTNRKFDVEALVTKAD